MKSFITIVLLLLLTASYGQSPAEKIAWSENHYISLSENIEYFQKKTVSLNDFDSYVLQTDNTQYQSIKLHIPDLYLSGISHDVMYKYYYYQSQPFYIFIRTMTYDNNFKDVTLYTEESFYVYNNEITTAYLRSVSNTNVISPEIPIQPIALPDSKRQQEILKKAFTAWNICNP